jgi:hypothetical protein
MHEGVAGKVVLPQSAVFGEDALTALPVMAYKTARNEYDLSIQRLWKRG